MTCAFHHLGGCNGRLDPHHIITRNTLRREYPLGAIKREDRWHPIKRGTTVSAKDQTRSLEELIADESNTVALCRIHHARVHSGGPDRILLDPPEEAVRFAVGLGMEATLLKARERAA